MLWILTRALGMTDSIGLRRGENPNAAKQELETAGIPSNISSIGGEHVVTVSKDDHDKAVKLINDLFRGM